jgi:glycosyltransferase involved in cell wall biosynthesis
MPFLSIIVPVYNRERFVSRCLDSILVQSMTDYEIIVVDDASTDQSLEVLKGYSDRICLLWHAQNMGALMARNTGVQRATGLWTMFVDSDDELVSGALDRIDQHLSALSSDITGAMFRCRWDNGNVSPWHMPTGDFDYISYIRFLDLHRDHPHDFLNCARRSSFAVVSSTNSRIEDLYCLDFHMHFKSLVFPDILLLCHQDAGNQTSQRLANDLSKNEMLSRNRAVTMKRLLDIHGPAMRRYAPRLFHQYASRLATLEFVLGDRHQGMHYSLEALHILPWHVRSWAVPILGMTGMIKTVRTMRSA